MLTHLGGMGHRHIAEYFIENVFEMLSRPVRRSHPPLTDGAILVAPVGIEARPSQVEFAQTVGEGVGGLDLRPEGKAVLRPEISGRLPPGIRLPAGNVFAQGCDRTSQCANIAVDEVVVRTGV